MNIEYLDEFVYLADTLSFSRTANHFYVSRSVISRHVAALEETVGARLVDRDNRSVALTGAGQVFYQEAKAVLRAWESAIDRAREAQGASQPVRVGYLRNASRPVLAMFVRRMAEAYPHVQLSLVCMAYGELRHALEEREVDVAVAMNVNPEISRNYRSTLIYEDRFYAVCAIDHPLARKNRPLALDDLRGQEVLLPEGFSDVGLADLVDGLMGAGAVSASQGFYHDIDMLDLKVQTEGCVAFSSGLNNARFGDQFAKLKIAGVNTSFTVSAFYHDGFVGETHLACSDAFEWCRSNLGGVSS